VGIKTLVLTVEYPSRASYYDDWRDAFSASPHFDVTVTNVFHAGERSRVRRGIGDYDLIVALHACTADSLLYVEPLVGALQSRRGKLLSFVGNELNLPWAPLAAKISWLTAVGADLVATQLLDEAGRWLYEATGAKVISVPHALNPQAFTPGPDQASRPIDLGARSFRYLPYLGDEDRNRIFDRFAQGGFDPPFRLDFSNEHRFDRVGWHGFLASCKGTVATEAGSWYLERDDATVLAVRDFLAARRPRGRFVLKADSPMRRLAHRLPYGVKAALRPLLRQGPIRHEALEAEGVDAAEVLERFFKGKPKPPVYAKCISSRHFDAIGSRTVQIMFPGRYNDILVADEDYIALSPDFGNVDEVVRRFRDGGHRQALADRALEKLLVAHTYQHRTDGLAKELGA
jgi:hypothetical protein